MSNWILPVIVTAAMMGGGWCGVARATTATEKQQRATATEKIHFAAVMINGKEVLRLAETADMTPTERADFAQERLIVLITPPKGMPVKPVEDAEVVVTLMAGQPEIHFRGQRIADVTGLDAQLHQLSMKALAARWAADLRRELKGVHVAVGKPLPKDVVTVSSGLMERPRGGGAGAAPPKKEAPKKGHEPTKKVEPKK